MSFTKNGLSNIEGKLFDVVHGVEGDCLILGDEDGGTRISGPKPWGGGQVIKTFVTQEKYGPVEYLEAENVKLRELVSLIWLAGDFSAFLGIDEVKEQMRELGVEVDG